MAFLTIKLTPAAESVAQKFSRLASTGIYESIARKGAQIDAMLMGSLQSEAPTRSGHYASTIRSTQHGGKGGITYVYTAEQPLSTWIVAGTSPHEIVPVNGKVLAFMGQGGMVFTRHVNHPGTKPNDFPARAWQNVAGDVLALWSSIGEDVKAEVSG